MDRVGGLRLTEYLEFISDAGTHTTPNGSKFRLIRVRCVCGTEKVVRLHSVTSGKLKSCGCAKRRSKTLSKDLIKANITANENGCWIWKGSKRGQMGYGQINYKRDDGLGKQTSAHRASWEAFHGEIPAGLLVLHRCNVPACCNPEHLYLGSLSDNSKDRWSGPTSESSRKSLLERIRSGKLKQAFEDGRRLGREAALKSKKGRFE